MKLNYRQSAVLMACLMFLFVLPRNAFSATQHVTACETQITTSGLWVVDNDLTCAANAISIEVSNVTLKLQGHTLTGNGGASGVSVETASGTGVKNVTVLGPGTITNFGIGVLFLGTTGGGIVDVSVTYSGNGLYLTSDANNVLCSGLLIARNSVQSANYAIALSGVTKSTIVGNNASSGGVGFYLSAVTSTTLLANTSNSNTAHGIEIATGSSSNTIEGNTSNSNLGAGIYIFAGTSKSHLSGNTASGNGSLDIADGNTGCTTDTYKNDVFSTSNQACVK